MAKVEGDGTTPPVADPAQEALAGLMTNLVMQAMQTNQQGLQQIVNDSEKEQKEQERIAKEDGG